MNSRKAIIISAPSGSGKTTIVKSLLHSLPDLKFSISATSRDPRPGEQNGKDYYFLSRKAFVKQIEDNRFIEWEEVYGGSYYGTLKSDVERIWANGDHVIFDVDVKGGIKLKKYFGNSGLSIFITVKSIEELEKRLKRRRTENEDTINIRLEKAAYELQFRDHFDVIILNEELKEAVSETTAIVRSFLKE